MWVQRWFGAQPGMPSDLAIPLQELQSATRLIQVKRTGQVMLVFPVELVEFVVELVEFVVEFVVELVELPELPVELVELPVELVELPVELVVELTVELLRSPMRADIDVEHMMPLGSEEYCQNMTPVFHPLNLKLATRASLMLVGLMYELGFPSAVVAAFPTTILEAGTPRAMISLTEVPGAHPPETLKSN